jgi:hypothetical protein
MMDETGSLRLAASLTPPWHRSPVSRKPVDDFALLPSVLKRAAWVQFVDWNNDGSVSVAEVATVIAAMLPIDENKAESFVSKRFDKAGKGVLSKFQIMRQVLPFLQKSAGRLVLGRQAPRIYNSSTGEAFFQWFDHWDKRHCGHITTSHMRLALLSSFEGEGTPSVRQVMVSCVLEDAGLTDNDNITKAQFLQHIVPLLQLNLPSRETSSVGTKEQSIPFDPKGDISIRLLSAMGKTKRAVVAGRGTVETLRAETRRQFRVWLASRDARLCLAGKFLEDDDVALASLPDLYGNSVVQVFPMIRVVVPYAKAKPSTSSMDSGISDSGSDEEFSEGSSDGGSSCPETSDRESRSHSH